MSHIDKQDSRGASNAENEHVSLHVGAAVTVQATPLDTITFAIGEGRTYQKVWTPAAMEAKSAEPVRLCTFNQIEERPFNDLPGLMDLLKEYGSEGWCAVRGQLLPHTDIEAANVGLKGNERLYQKVPDVSSDTEKVLYARRKDKTLADVPRRWALFDLDSPPGSVLDLSSQEACDKSIRTEVAKQLGSEFGCADFGYLLSGSAGIKPGVRAHVWVLFPEPITNAELKAWRERRIDKLKEKSGRESLVCDGGVFNAVQPHFCAPPRFEGCDDPIEACGLERWRFCEGIEHRVHLEDLPTIRAAAAAQVEKVKSANRVFDVRELPARRGSGRTPGTVEHAFNTAFPVSHLIETRLGEHFELAHVSNGYQRVVWRPRGDEAACYIQPDDDALCSFNANTWPFGSERGVARSADAFALACYFLHGDDYGKAKAWAAELPEVRAVRQGFAAAADQAAIPPNNAKLGDVYEWEPDLYKNAVTIVEHLARKDVLFSGPNGVVEITQKGTAPLTSKDRVRVLCGSDIQWQKTGKDPKPFSPKGSEYGEVCGMVVQMHDHKSLRPLDAVVRLPIYRLADKQLLLQGYHDKERRYVMLSTAWDAFDVPMDPTREDAEAAYRYLVDEVLDGFEFATPNDEAAAVALLCTAATRSSFPAAPAFYLGAGQPGAGKTTLGRMSAALAGQDAPSVTSWPGGGRDKDEMRKALHGSLESSQSAILFDNIPGGHVVDDPHLCAVLTTSVWNDRKLGGNKIAALQTRVLMMFNGNNLSFMSDITSRVIPLRLTSKARHADERAFTRNDPAGWVVANRPAIMQACLTIMRARATVGESVEATKAGDVERRVRMVEWDNHIRRTVEAVAGHDPAVGLLELKDIDPRAEGRGNVLRALAECFGGEKFKAAQVVEKVQADQWSEGGLTVVLREENVTISKNGISRRLSEIQDNPSGGLCLRHSTKEGTRVFWVEGGEGFAPQGREEGNVVPLAKKAAVAS